MSLVFLVALGLSFAEPEKAVTEADKKAFLDLLRTLPTRRHSFTKEAIEKAAPHTRVLLALTSKDIGELDLYPFLALSSGLASRKDARDYAVANFAKIAHPTLKLAWASMLLDQKAASTEIVTFLRKAIEAKDDSTTLADMLGSEYEDFRARVIEADDLRQPMKLALAREYSMDAFPPKREGFSHTNDQWVFAPGRSICVVRPVEQRGELNTYSLADGKTSRTTIPQPDGVKPPFPFATCFDNAVLSLNVHGDFLCRWNILGNGDHGLAVIVKESGVVVVKRVGFALDASRAVADAEGQWYLIVLSGSAGFTVYHVDQRLNLTRLGNFKGRGFHGTKILDATFIAKDTLHLFWGDVLPGDHHVRMRCVDFEVKKRTWLHAREIFRLDRFVSSASEPTVLRLNDESIHYVWKIDEGERKSEASGLYYQAEADGKTVKVCDARRGHRAVAMGDRIVVCYTLEDSPEKVFFRIIRHGTLGPVTEIVAAKGRKHNLWSEYLLLHGEADRIWFVNALTANRVFELKLAEQGSP